MGIYGSPVNSTRKWPVVRSFYVSKQTVKQTVKLSVICDDWTLMRRYYNKDSQGKYRSNVIFIFTMYRQVFNISRTLVGNKIVDHSDVIGASPVGAAPTTSSFST